MASLDLITFFFFYHDTTYMTVDRAAMNKKLFAALKPGGVPGDRRPFGQGRRRHSVGKTLHRIEESVLRSEVEAAGFKLVGRGRFPAPSRGPRDERIFRSKVPVDEFVLKFQKPH